jgi:hypothetical protein
LNKYDTIVLYLPSKYKYNAELITNNHNHIKDVGINIKPLDRQEGIKLVVTSKILRNRYSELINKDNIELVHDILSNYIEIPYSEFLNNPIHGLHATSDIQVDNPGVTIQNLFDLAKFQTIFTGRKNCWKTQGVATSFYLKNTNLNNRYNEYFTVYNKLNELIDHKTNANIDLRNSLTLGEWESLIAYYQKKVRIEVKLLSQVKIRQYLGLERQETLTLNKALISEVNIVKRLLSNIYSNIAAVQFKNYDFKKPHQLYFYQMCEKFNFDETQITAYLKTTFDNKTFYREKKKVRELMTCVNPDVISLISNYESIYNSL